MVSSGVHQGQGGGGFSLFRVSSFQASYWSQVAGSSHSRCLGNLVLSNSVNLNYSDEIADLLHGGLTD